MADKELGQKRRRLRGKSKVQMQDDAAAKRSLSVPLYFPEIAMASFKKVQEIEDIIDDEEFVLLYEA